MEAIKIGCVIMASGQSKRFGENKLLAQFRGKAMIQHVLDITGGDMFSGRVVVTRSKEVETLCLEQGIDVVYHELPNRNDTVRLGVLQMEKIAEIEGCMFCPCDQPLLRRESLALLVDEFVKCDHRENKMFRLAAKERPGTPILFGKNWLDKLKRLPEKNGGGYLAKQYPERVKHVWIKDADELFDVDTKEDLRHIAD